MDSNNRIDPQWKGHCAYSALKAPQHWKIPLIRDFTASGFVYYIKAPKSFYLLQQLFNRSNTYSKSLFLQMVNGVEKRLL